jgi:two-component system cell cycle response regulator CpdR
MVSRVVLVVDDEPLVLDVTASMLEDIGCEVITAASGEDALDLISTDPRIEILITDINMPDMDGYALAHLATEMRKPLKVIVLSGQESDGRGFPLVRKPFLREDLRKTMAQHTGLC